MYCVDSIKVLTMYRVIGGSFIGSKIAESFSTAMVRPQIGKRILFWKTENTDE